MNRNNAYSNTVEDLATQLASSIFQTIQVLGTLVRANEKNYNGSHSQFVAEKSAEVATNLGLSPGEVFEIKTAALLHDIGKIGFPDFLLMKHPQELSTNDYQYYSKHVEDGRRILSMQDGLSNIAEIVYQHHEKHDGTGFPQKLKRDEIHPGAQIISVVNYYHNAMERVQKEKTPSSQSNAQITSTSTYLHTTQPRFAQTMNYLNHRSGSTFAPIIVDAFIAIIENDRRNLGEKTIMRLAVNQVKPGMVFASDYHTSYGLLIAARGEPITDIAVNRLISLAELGEIPQKVLVMK
ncbi:MAG: HD domain-containing protein [Ignavibacteria bacterium]|nr:HD domain-containing protein [Ignavibacteria bacterium]